MANYICYFVTMWTSLDRYGRKGQQTKERRGKGKMVNLIFDPRTHFHQESEVISNKTADSKLIQLVFS